MDADHLGQIRSILAQKERKKAGDNKLLNFESVQGQSKYVQLLYPDYETIPRQATTAHTVKRALHSTDFICDMIAAHITVSF